MVKAIVVGSAVCARKKALMGKKGKVVSMKGAGHSRRFEVRWYDNTKTFESSRSLTIDDGPTLSSDESEAGDANSNSSDSELSNLDNESEDLDG